MEDQGAFDYFVKPTPECATKAFGKDTSPWSTPPQGRTVPNLVDILVSRAVYRRGTAIEKRKDLRCQAVPEGEHAAAIACL